MKETGLFPVESKQELWVSDDGSRSFRRAGTAQSIDFGVTYFGTLFNGDTEWGGHRFENSLKLIGGLFQTDENQGFWANAGMLLSRWTWESPQEIAGLGYSHYRNFTGDISRVDYLGGATFATNENTPGGEGISLGSYININLDGEITGNFADFVKSNPGYMHEYGHTFDSRRYGLSYLLAIGIPSLISASKHDGQHYKYWTETRANRHAEKYFGKYYGVDWDNDTFWYEPWKMYRKIKDRYPTH